MNNDGPEHELQKQTRVSTYVWRLSHGRRIKLPDKLIENVHRQLPMIFYGYNPGQALKQLRPLVHADVTN